MRHEHMRAEQMRPGQMRPAHLRTEQTGPHRTVPVQEFGGPVRSHSARKKLSKKWRLVPVAALAAALAGGAALAATGAAGIKFNVVSPVTVQALGVDLTDAPVGQPVTAGAKIVAESATTLDAAVIAVRDPDGKTVDFPDVLNYKLGTSQQVFTQTKAFDKPGTYTYWFAYKKNNRWTGLNPRQTFTVGGVSTQPGATPSPSATTTPAPSPTATSPSPTATSTTSPTGGSTGGTGTGSTTPPGGTSARGCMADPSACGLPDADNTGVPAGKSLTVISGNYTISTAGAVVDGKEIRGCVEVRAANVTIRNSRIVAPGCFNAVRNFSTGLTMSDVEISCGNSHGTGVTATNYTVIRADISGCENGFNVGGSVVVEDSYIHDLYALDGAHTDGAQFNQGASNITFRHNTILSPAPGGTSAIIMWDENDPQNSNVLITGNLLAGGTYTLYCPRNNSSNVNIVGNRFGNYEYGSTNSCVSGHVAQFSGNVRDSDGTALSGG
jgi:hypothetical protein